MKTLDEKPGLLFYLGWVFLNIFAVIVAWFIAWALIKQITSIVGDRIMIGGQSRITEDAIFLYTLLPVIGLLIGTSQYWLLRHYLPRMSWWIAATVIGWLMPFVIGFIGSRIFGPGNDSLSIMLGMLILGASISLPQWLVLRQRVKHAYLWILAYGLSWFLIGVMNYVTTEPFPVLLAISLIPTITTGTILWLFLDWYPTYSPQLKLEQ